MEALRKYEDFFEYAADGMAIIDADGNLLYVNREGRRLLGRTREELKNAPVQGFLADESVETWAGVVQQVRRGRFKRSFDVFIARPDGSERIFSLSAGGVGQETGLTILSFRDVTETREMEGELRTTKEFLENLIDNSVDAIVAADMDGNIMLFNKGAERIWGHKGEDVIGRTHVSQLYPSSVASDIMRKLRDDTLGGRGRLEAHRREIVTSSVDIVPVSMTASIIYEDGEEVATVGVYTDLRDRLTIERRLSEAQEQLIKSEKTRVAAELAGMAAHELNQPLTSVLGYAEMLKNRIPEGDTKLRRPVDTIFKQAERMAEIVRKIGRITKYETKRYGGNTDMIDLNRAAPEGNVTAPPGSASRPTTLESEEGEPISASMGSPSMMARLASMPSTKREGVDIRASIVRMDTVENTGYVRAHSTPPSQAPRADDPAGKFTGMRSDSQVPLPRSITTDLPPSIVDEGDDTNPGVRLHDVGKRKPDPKPE